MQIEISPTLKRFGAIAVFLLASVEAWPSCIVDADHRSEVQVSHSELSGSARPPVYLADCKGVQVTGAPATVCWKGNDGTPQCEDLQPGVRFAGVSKRDPTLQSSFAYLLQGAPRQRDGGSRMDEARIRIPGLPYGKVLPPDGTLRLILTSPVIAGRGGTFALTARDKGAAPVFTTNVAAGARSLEIPAQALRQGSGFSWTLNLAGESYRGQFSLATSSELADMAADLKAVQNAANISQHTRKLWTAMVYDDNGFAFDSERLQLELRQGE